MAGKSAVEDLCELLRRHIVEQMRVGDLLPNERELAEHFGVARNTVRETLIHLEVLGLIEKTRRGARVRTPNLDPVFSVFAQYFDKSAKTMSDVLNFRRIVEVGAAPLAVIGATDATFVRMTDANVGLARAMTVSEAAAHDFDFHNALIEATNNTVLVRIYRVLAVPLKYYFEVGKSHSPETEKSCAEHSQIIVALRARDARAVVGVLNNHFDHSAAVFAEVTEWLAQQEPKIA